MKSVLYLAKQVKLYDMNVFFFGNKGNDLLSICMYKHNYLVNILIFIWKITFINFRHFVLETFYFFFHGIFYHLFN